MSLILFIIWILGFGYIFQIYSFYRKLPSDINPLNPEHSKERSVTVIIPFRNEEQNLQKLLESFKNQSYPKNKTLFLFVNDHSEDQGKEIITKFASFNGDLNIEILDLEEGINGKKAALRKAYQHTHSEVLISTDADCEMHKEWITFTVQAFEKEEVQMLCGGVKIKNEGSWISQFQSVELLSLIGSGAAAIQLGNPIMSNGANLAFRKSVLNEIDFSNLKPDTASGDDVYLLMEVFKQLGPQAICFQFHPNHWVKTKAIKYFDELVQQRIRWTSKSKTYKNHYQVFLSLLVFLSNLAIPVLFLWSLFSLQILPAFIFYWLLKMLIDFLFLKKVAELSKQKFEIQNYINTAIIYPFFISYIGIIGQFAEFKWKDRKYSQ